MMQPPIILSRWLGGAALLLALCFAAAEATAGIKSERLLAAILMQTPSSILVPAGQQWSRAEAAAAEVPGATAFWGVGESMEPLYPDRTAIVVAPVAFAELRKGMTVVYMTSRGRMVAHSLTGDLPKGWIAQGISNAREDDELVTRHNLVGVIVEAYSEIPSSRRMALTNDLVAKRRLSPSRS
jgi:hypothetical protein